MATKTSSKKTPRYYQGAAVKALLGMMREKKNPLGVLAGGAGKTLIISMIMSILFKEKKRVLYVAHRKELLLQVRRRLTVDGGLSAALVGLVMGGQFRDLDRPLQVASIQSLQHMKNLEEFDCIVFDEAHRAVAPTYMALRARMPNAMVVGLTATPTRLDGKPLGAAFTDMLEIEKLSVLLEKGFLSKPRCFSDKAELLPDLTGLPSSEADYQLLELEKRVNKPRLIGGILANYIRWVKGRQFIGFASSVKHSRSLVRKFNKAGVSCAHLDAHTPQHERDEVVRKFIAGEILGIWNFDLLSEGFDLPACRVCIMARPTKSTVKYMQQAARIMRPFKGEDCILLDHALNIVRHDFPHLDRRYTLEQGEIKEGTRLGVKVCPECGQLMPVNAAECENCGHSFAREERKKVKEDQRILEEVTREEYEQVEARILAYAKKEKFSDPERFTKRYMEDWKKQRA